MEVNKQMNTYKNQVIKRYTAKICVVGLGLGYDGLFTY